MSCERDQRKGSGSIKYATINSLNSESAPYAHHQHVEYQGIEAVISIPDGEMIEGELPPKKLRMLQAWIAIHEEELMADWALAVKGEPIFKIEPLR